MRASVRCFAAGGASATIDLAGALTPTLRDRARADTNEWIKSLRHAPYGGRPMRARFSYRDDSLWWFTELYLQKMRRLDTASAALLGLDAIAATHAPARIEVTTRDAAVRETAIAFGRARGIAVTTAGGDSARAAHGWPGFLVGLTAELSRLRPQRPPRRVRPAKVAAFVHTAFWRGGDGDDGAGQEHYLGPVLEAIAERAGAHGLACVGLGPRRNFRTRRWWDPMTSRRPAITAIEQLAPRAAVKGALDLWRRRDALADEIVTGDGIRAAALRHGCDLWPVLAHELRGVALVQWPWSARAMDEAGAAIEALTPEAIVTYAEAGGWGRALVLEARRRGVPSIGVQHGFIYRHWLNYLHAADEMAALDGQGGAPIPTRTLVFDRYAADHLAQHGAFPADALRIVGSPRLDELAVKIREAGAPREDPRPLVVLAAKHSEVAAELPALFDAVGARPDVRLIVKPHPAEPADVYASAAGGRSNIEIAPPSADLAALLAGAAALVTMNSTVAIDGLVLGVPALVVGLPNNLSPFVDAGVMVGAARPAEVGPRLEALLYDRQVREDVLRRAAAFAARYEMRADGGAAARAADEVLAMTRTR